jgi:ubiquinone/menaquinone biosynthesis C-methylase UbiE
MRDETSYRIIAPYYDWIMAHVDYDAWGRHLTKLWHKFGVDPKTILEIGAGTCPFARREVYPPDAQVIYSDLSQFMLAQAHDVASIQRVAANALSLPFRGPFQLCVMIYDAINYLMEEEDVARCFDEVYRILGTNGLFIFDITTEENSRRHFHQAVDFGEMAGCTYYRESSFDREAQLQSNDFVFFVEGKRDCWRKIKESHQQRIYKVEQLRALAENSGFTIAGVFEGFTFRSGREASERIHFVLRKP